MRTKLLDYPIEKTMPARLLTGIIFLTFAILCLVFRPLKNEINWWVDWLFFLIFSLGGFFKLVLVLKFWLLKYAFIRNNEFEDNYIKIGNSWLFGPSYLHLDNFSRVHVSENTIRLFYGSGKYLDLDKKNIGSVIKQKLEKSANGRVSGKSIQAYERSA
ncbi:MAG: hypothetical protein JJU28_10560 [Cyclobacteriaceae bacterium]|nr:hypothetical protein [Cyclobacteriaceae bacterium]